MNESNTYNEAVKLLDKKVRELIERLSFQREENLKLKSRVMTLEQSKMVLEEEVTVLNRRLSEAQENFSEMGSVQHNDEVEKRIDNIIKELQECIDEIH